MLVLSQKLQFCVSRRPAHDCCSPADMGQSQPFQLTRMSFCSEYAWAQTEEKNLWCWKNFKYSQSGPEIDSCGERQWKHSKAEVNFPMRLFLLWQLLLPDNNDGTGHLFDLITQKRTKCFWLYCSPSPNEVQRQQKCGSKSNISISFTCIMGFYVENYPCLLPTY